MAQPSGATAGSRQSVWPSSAITEISTSKLPPSSNGVVNPSAYAGGSVATQTEEPDSPVISTPPRQGPGASPVSGMTHSATEIPTSSRNPVHETVTLLPTDSRAVCDTESSCSSGPVLVVH